MISKFGIEVFVAEWQLSPGENISNKVLRNIDKADCMVVLLTAHGIRSNWVQQEVGYALRKKKWREGKYVIIPLIEKGIDKNSLGALEGLEYIEYDPYNPHLSLNKLSIFIKALKLKKNYEEKTLWVVGGIAAFLMLLAYAEEKNEHFL
ncbi:MAG: hypothetical protein A2Y62_16705 [Candidatus Fischerbacteria bacterium RBG_13_37_8]|uniref:TIR domain-containing protein n=1 Tax=Candidatus Fischerbacteria bacterium RBG_13_37_8 TaxID=1817863 RepID=A0A1F5V5A8_9BACT|nr:MAG: hypothetical protein A2Y62_16705 [Candidatus Fischerbacteria bacterium RBG_13_37_8]